MAETAHPSLAAPGYVVPSPDPASLIVWPADFGQRFTIFIDTEEEFDWNAPFSREARATTAIAALPVAHRFLADRGAHVTLMVDHPVATDQDAVATIATLMQGDAPVAVGTQLHPWVSPPFDEAVSPRNSYAGNLLPGLEAAKLDALTTAIADAFGTPPLCYRAGRYGIGPRTLALLAERGYRLDSSMRSRYDYRAQGGPDFGAIGNAAFRAGPEGAILELPLTTVFTGLARRRGAALYRRWGGAGRIHGFMARAGILARIALTPEEMPVADALEAVRIAVGEGVRVLNMSFHSPSLVPGHTPYVRTAADLARFYDWWDRMLALLDRLGVRAASLDDLLAAADRGR